MSPCANGWMDETESAEERVEKTMGAAWQDEVGGFGACVRACVRACLGLCACVLGLR